MVLPRLTCSRSFVMLAIMLAFPPSGLHAWAQGFDCATYQKTPLPAEAAAAPVPSSSPACASYRSYKGIGRPVDYAAARACAWQERLAQQANLGQAPKELTAWVVGGSLILADLYANGAGVPRNPALALRFACETDPHMASDFHEAMEKQTGKPARPLELCDSAQTTFMVNFCSDYQDQVAEQQRKHYFDNLKAKMTPPQQAAFDKLLQAHNAFLLVHVDEVDQGGTIRNIRTLGSQNILKKLFRNEVAKFLNGKWPAISPEQISAADAQMQDEYSRQRTALSHQTRQMLEAGAVSAEGLAKAQQSWQTYRDAWVAFAKTYDPAKADAVRAEITLDRYRYLKTITASTD